MPTKTIITNWYKQLQDAICQSLEQLDGKATFKEDSWERPGGGGGRSRILTEGNIIEKGGVNFSAVHGQLSERTKGMMKLTGDFTFYATGVSIVLHPNNPHVPIIHMNIRYFELSNGKYWFGGGIDLTPHYIHPEEAQFFHQALKDACDPHDEAYYPKFKEWADNYFYIPHRKETRGVGGIFFDHLSADEQHTKADIWAFQQSVGQSFAPTYAHFMTNKGHLPFTEQERYWQLVRRSRYVEFNLVWDRGTKFGLQTDARIESVLMSMPPLAKWVYNYQPLPNSPEANTQAYLKKGVHWLEG